MLREQLFINPKTLPEFTLKVIKAPQTITGNATEYDSWLETLRALEKKVQQEKFNVAIIGCGAYGFPLAATIKKIDFFRNSTSATNCCVAPVLEASHMSICSDFCAPWTPCTSSAEASLERSLMGKVAIHLGGATQLLFGVSGNRWRNHPQFKNIITDAWSPPLESERPPGWEKIENGCYW